MTPDEKVDVLSQVDLFEKLDGDSLGELAQDAQERSYSTGDVLYPERDPANELWIVASGSVALGVTRPAGEEAVINTLRPVTAFGEAALFDDEGGRMVSARAAEDTVVLTLPRDRFVTLVREQPDVAEALLRMMAKRLREAAQRG
jgi:CRP-like cAMP-binding protein